jgi:predicted phosphodiesterase
LRLRRFGILGDIHAEHELLAAALERLTAEAVDAVLAVGDIVDGLGSPVECCNLLAASGAWVVRGNHERWFLEGKMRDLPEATPASEVNASARAFLASLPPTRRVDTVRGTLLLCHGTGDDDMNAVRPEDSGYALETNEALQSLIAEGAVAFLVCGHSHRRMVRRIGPLTIINAGTLRRGEDPGFGIVDLGEDPHVSFFERNAGGAIVTIDGTPLSLPPRSTRAT